jgi:hypothetical protein
MFWINARAAALAVSWSLAGCGSVLASELAPFTCPTSHHFPVGSDQLKVNLCRNKSTSNSVLSIIHLPMNPIDYQAEDAAITFIISKDRKFTSSSVKSVLYTTEEVISQFFGLFIIITH